MKTIKVIDLLNKIANGEEVPRKIKWENTIYAYSAFDKDYLEFPFSEEEYKGFFNMRDIVLTQCLYDQVEILEEKKKIEKLNFSGNGHTDYTSVIPKINEIIDKVNAMEE